MNNYWNNRYLCGNSGEGSVGLVRDYKWSIIDRYIEDISRCSVIDIGCGDLSFWEGRECVNYIGVDSSSVVIERNMRLRKDWKFINKSAGIYINGIKSDVVFCFDTLFHIMDDVEYFMILDNLCKYSNDYIFIYTWVINPFKDKEYISAKKLYKSGCYVDLIKYLVGMKSNTDDLYQKFRNFCDHRYLITSNGFLLVGIFGNVDIDKYGAMFIFRKIK